MSSGRQILLRVIPAIAAVLLMLFFLRLGFWQLDRAEQKQQLVNAFATNVNAEPQLLERFETKARFTPVRLRGRFVDGRTVLLDNQIRERQAGVHVFQVFQPAAGGPAILVNRGWQAFSDRSTPPDPAALTGPRDVIGFLNQPPAGGVRLGEQLIGEQSPLVVTYLEPEQLIAWAGTELAPQVLLATDETAFTSDWQPNLMPPERHRGYAVQWFALAVTVLLVTIVLQWRGVVRASKNRT